MTYKSDEIRINRSKHFFTRRKFLGTLSAGTVGCLGFIPFNGPYDARKGTIIPQPRSITYNLESFEFDNRTTISRSEGLENKAIQLLKYIEPAMGYELSPALFKEGKSNVVNLILDTSLENLGMEGYTLSVNSHRIDISAYSERGIFYGIQTLRQLLPYHIESKKHVSVKWTIGGVEISDTPRFPWRGLMMDCSRTFWDKDYIKKLMDLMALYKMNVLHLHLTDDQGWRIQIDKYPELTKKGARFPDKYNEPEERQGFYSKDDIQDLINHADQRNIMIVPEIEMPGHVLAVLACYPDLACLGMENKFEIHPFFQGPSVHKEILCAGYDKVYQFVEDVLDETIELFPSEYIHVGGDEAPKTAWEQCPRCQKKINKEGLHDEEELQSYFMKRISNYIEKHGKKMIGWDEILQGGVAPNATVMSWRGMKGGESAAKQGNDVVMSPNTYCYFDYTYEKISTTKVYELEPIPEGLTFKEQDHILGAQANFWSHIDRTESRVDGQLFPRLLSIAEVTWSPHITKDIVQFKGKVRNELKRLSKLDVDYYNDQSIFNE